MIDSAEQARAAASFAGFALRLVNERAAECLIAAVDRGETRARLFIDEVRVPHAAGRIGRLYGDKLIDALEAAGERGLARACRIFVTLGFDVATAPAVERDNDAELTVEVVTGIRIDHLELGFATAVDALRPAVGTLPQAVALPAAHLWRARAEAARRIDAFERKALALIAERADRGVETCRLPWHMLAPAPPDLHLLQRLVDRLRSRGFRVEQVDASATLVVDW